MWSERVDRKLSTSHAVQELIPEFYLSSTAFLNNRLQLTLGTRQVRTFCLPHVSPNTPACMRIHAACTTVKHESRVESTLAHPWHPSGLHVLPATVSSHHISLYM